MQVSSVLIAILCKATGEILVLNRVDLTKNTVLRLPAGDKNFGDSFFILDYKANQLVFCTSETQ